jgi:hypothetical protein
VIVAALIPAFKPADLVAENASYISVLKQYIIPDPAIAAAACGAGQ